MTVLMVFALDSRDEVRVPPLFLARAHVLFHARYGHVLALFPDHAHVSHAEVIKTNSVNVVYFHYYKLFAIFKTIEGFYEFLLNLPADVVLMESYQMTSLDLAKATWSRIARQIE